MVRSGGIRIVLTVLVLLTWITLFVLCGAQPVKPYLDQLERATSFSAAIRLVPQVIIFWGWPNIAILCVLAALAGESARNQDVDAAGAMARGFFVFLFAIGGQLIYVFGHGEPDFFFIERQVYFRLAGLTSFVAFVVGWSPDTVALLAAKLGEKLSTEMRPHKKPPV
jgi:hypothetical protein